MKVAVDYQSALQSRRTGIGNVTLELVRAMRAEASGIEFLLYGAQDGKDLGTPARLWRENVALPRRALRDGADILYYPGFSPALACRIPQVVTVHDLIGLAMPGNHRALSASRFYWSAWLPRAVRAARRIAVPSEATRRDLKKYLGIDQARVSVVPWGAADIFKKAEDAARVKRTLEKLSVRGPYLVAAGTLEPRKNHFRLLQACRTLKDGGELSFSLVIAGKDGGEGARLKRYAREQGLEAHVRFLDYVSDEELVHLYNGSIGYAMISLYEGFGLPVLEAMRCGKSGVIATGTSLPEVAGDTALAVEPYSVEAVAHALREFAGDAAMRGRLEAAAYARSQTFSYKKAAVQMIGIFREAL